MSGGDFTPVLEIVLFCICLFLAGILCKKIGFSPIIGEMIVGVLLGPNGLDVVPYEQFFRLAGVFGVTLMIFESGLHVDFTMLKKVGVRASVVAVLGTFLPMISGMYVMVAFDADRYAIWPVGLASGVTLAPTSVGMALKMLGEKKQLGEEYGQLIVTVRAGLLFSRARGQTACRRSCRRCCCCIGDRRGVCPGSPLLF